MTIFEALKINLRMFFFLGLLVSLGCAAPDYDDLVAQDQPVLYAPLPGDTCFPNGDSARTFNGQEYVEFTDSDLYSINRTGSLTLEAWIRPDVLEFQHQEGMGYVNWAGKGTPGQHEWVLRMYSLTNGENRPNRISGYAFNLSGGLGIGSYFQDTVENYQWIHVVVVYNTNPMPTYPTGYVKIYKNGVLRDKDSLTHEDPTRSIEPKNGTAPVRIGTRDFRSYFQGAIGRFAIYDYELSQNRIHEHTLAGGLD